MRKQPGGPQKGENGVTFGVGGQLLSFPCHEALVGGPDGLVLDALLIQQRDGLTEPDDARFLVQHELELLGQNFAEGGVVLGLRVRGAPRALTCQHIVPQGGIAVLLQQGVGDVQIERHLPLMGVIQPKYPHGDYDGHQDKGCNNETLFAGFLFGVHNVIHSFLTHNFTT